MNCTSRSISISILIACITVLTSTANAQVGEDGILFYPPKLTVENIKRTNTVGPNAFEIKEAQTHLSLVPIPIIFFDGVGSTVVPTRYQLFTWSADCDFYADTNFIWGSTGPFGKYREMLNIIGYRMRMNPDATITLEGGFATESGENGDVARERADVVREYLTTIWKINPERIAIAEPRPMCDSSAPPFLRDEARCVVIHTENRTLFNEIHYTKRTRYVGIYHTSIQLEPLVDPEELSAIAIDMYLGDSLFCSIALPIVPGALSYQLVQMWDMIPPLSFRTDRRITYKAWVTMRDGNVRESNAASLEVYTKEIDLTAPDDTVQEMKFYLPYFGYREATLSRYHQQLLDRCIQENMSGDMNEEVNVTVVGQSDPGEHGTGRSTWRPTYSDELYEEMALDPASRAQLFPDMKEGEAGTNHVAKYLHWFSSMICGTMRGESVDSTLAQRRATAVADYIAQRVTVTPIVEGSSSTDNPYFPEHRFYDRGVTIVIARGQKHSSRTSEE